MHIETKRGAFLRFLMEDYWKADSLGRAMTIVIVLGLVAVIAILFNAALV